MFIVNIRSEGHEVLARQLAHMVQTKFIFDTGAPCEIIWLQDMFENELADAARVSKTKLTGEKYRLWFDTMNTLFGKFYVRDGIVEVLKQKRLSGVQLLLVADADFTKEYGEAFELWPKAGKMHLGLTFHKGEPGMLVGDDVSGAARYIIEAMTKRD